jgi:hypothetical protein
MRRITSAERLLLAFAVIVAGLYLAIGAWVPGILDNDAHYYYGVARHIALTGRFEEPIVWQFLHPPDRIVHPPFDYWGCLTSLLLVPSLVVFGVRPETALITISAISAISVMALWYLVCVALPLRHWSSQLVALAFFAFAPGMAFFRFQPESIAVAELFILLSVIALCVRRSVLAMLCGFGVLLARGDGLVFFGLVSVAVLLEARADPRQVATLVLVGGVCIATYMVWSVVAFGTFTPPGPRVVPFLSSYDVYDFGVSREPSFRQFLGWFRWEYIRARMWVGLESLRAGGFTPLGDIWLLIAFLSGGALLGSRRRMEVLVWVLCFGTHFLVAFVAGTGFASGRAPHALTPLVIIAGALGLDWMLGWLHPRLEPGWPRRAAGVLLGAGVLWSGVLFLEGVHTAQGLRYADRAELTRLDRMLRGEAVASDDPWRVIAYTRSPAVSIPSNGETAIATVLERYHVRWVVLSRYWLLRVGPESQRALFGVLSGKRRGMNRLRLKRVPVPVSEVVLRVR